ncbi:hypothetical protein [Methanocalculus sp.]|uniref:hypothetical protein n=1 Tax=Methanocalculus sp. TaxID=2004547 RepID=UPI00260E0C69|nr:hypothetical protein [Methanocalculus sp.]MDG6249440.1 hypothetical protein [Methanocalculus sp.]
MKWQVDLHGDANDLAELSEILQSTDFRVLNEGEKYLLEFTSLENSSDHKSVKAKADELLININAARKLLFNSSDLIKRGGIQFIDEDGKKTIFLEPLTASIHIRARVQVTVTKKDGTTVESPPDNKIIKLIRLAQTDERVQRVNELIDHDFNSFGVLYNIIELVQEDGYAPVKKNGEFYSEIGRFKQTAQSYDAIGKEARHARKKFQKPENPMELHDAQNLVKTIVRKWMNSKI